MQVELECLEVTRRAAAAVSGGLLNYTLVCACVRTHTICQWSWGFVLMCSDKQLRRAEGPPYILYTHTNTLTQSHRCKYCSSWWRGHDPCGVIMSPVKTDHQRIKKKSMRRTGRAQIPLQRHMVPNKIKQNTAATTRKQKELACETLSAYTSDQNMLALTF